MEEQLTAVHIEDSIDLTDDADAVIINERLVIFKFSLNIAASDAYEQIKDIMLTPDFWVLNTMQDDTYLYFVINTFRGNTIDGAPRHFTTGNEYTAAFESPEEWAGYIESIEDASVELTDFELDESTMVIKLLFIDCELEDIALHYNRIFHEGVVDSVHLLNGLWVFSVRVPRFNVAWELPISVDSVDDAISTYMFYHEVEELAEVTEFTSANFVQRIYLLLKYMEGVPTETIEKLSEISFLEFVAMAKKLHRIAGPYVNGAK